jgi:hypothetical protein
VRRGGAVARTQRASAEKVFRRRRPQNNVSARFVSRPEIRVSAAAYYCFAYTPMIPASPYSPASLRVFLRRLATEAIAKNPARARVVYRRLKSFVSLPEFALNARFLSIDVKPARIVRVRPLENRLMTRVTAPVRTPRSVSVAIARFHRCNTPPLRFRAASSRRFSRTSTDLAQSRVQCPKN